MSDPRRRAVSGFALYDVANSAFVTTVVSALGGPFLTALARHAAGTDGRLSVLGLPLRPGGVYAYAVSLSVLLQVLTLPALGAAADRAAGKRVVLLGGTLLGGAATLAVAATPAGTPQLGLAAFVVANVAFGAAVLAYNATLADVAAPADRDRVSALGFAAGYAGGGAVLAVALVLVALAGPLGLGRGGAVRLSIALSGVWWVLVGLVAVRRLDAARALPTYDSQRGSLTGRGVVSELAGSLRALRALPTTARFLAAFLLFNDAVQAVISLSAVVLTQELFVARGRTADDATGFLLLLVLLIQVVAVPGSLGCARLAARYGTKPVLLGTLVVWVAVVVYASVALDSVAAAYGLGVVIALVLGGSQSLARSQFSVLVPPARQASFFGFYELAERGTAWIGTLVFAVVFQLTGSYRGAFSSLLVLFVAGGALLAGTDTARGAALVSGPVGSGSVDEAGQEPLRVRRRMQ